MAINVLWDDHTEMTIRWDFDQLWTPEDLARAAQATINLVKGQPNTVDLILNMEHDLSFSCDFIFFRNTLKRMSRDVGLKIIVGASRLLQQFIVTFSKYDRDFVEGLTLLTSLDEARELLAA